MSTFLLLVGFHHERGNEVEWSYPCENPFAKDVERLNTLEFLAIPDQVHNNERDYSYFVLDDFLCVSAYEQIATVKVREKAKDVTRATIQKSLVYFSKQFNYTPLGLSYFRAKMQEAVHAYFVQAQQGSFSDRSILQAFYTEIPTLLSLIASPTAEIPEHKFLRASPVLRLLSRFGRSALSLLKLLMLEKKVIIYGIPVGETCDVVLALTALLPLHNEKHDQVPFMQESSVEPLEDSNGALTEAGKREILKEVVYDADEQEYSALKLPLRVSAFTYISGSVALNQADWLCGAKSFFVGSSNALFALNRQVLDLDATFDATTAQFTFHTPGLANATRLTPEDTSFVDFLITKIMNGGDVPVDHWNPNDASSAKSSDPFADFLLVEEDPAPAPLTHSPLISGKQASNSQFTPGTVTTWQTKETWVRTMFARYIKALLAGSSSQITGLSQSRVDAYGGHFLLDWQHTKNYRFWRTQIDVRALLADPTFSNMSHPGFSLPNTGAPTTLVGKSLQTVKGSFNTISSTTTNFVNALGNAWNQRAANQAYANSPSAQQGEVWGLDFGAADRSPSPSAQSPSTTSPPTSGSSTPAFISFSPPPGSSSEHPHGTPTRGGIGGFFDTVKQKVISPFGKTDRAFAQFEPLEAAGPEGDAPTVMQPAQPEAPSSSSSFASTHAQSTPNMPTAPNQKANEGEDLITF